MTVAKPLPHDAAPLHVTGQARYVDDIPVPANCLHLNFGTSAHARATITALDLTAVKSAPGVVAVLTADDLPAANDVSPSAHDEPLLATGEVFYIGQPIFLVVAETHLAARKAARLAEITYAEHTPLLTIDDALAANSRFEDGPREYGRGDLAAGFAAASTIVEGTLEMGGQEHFYLEGQAALALPQEGGDMLLHSSTQHPTEIQHKVAEALGTPMNAVRVETRRMGGGFGGKESQGNALACACAVVAHLTGRPAKMRYDRDDDMMITGKRHDFRITYRAGVDAEGKLTAVDFTQYARCGWAQDLSLPVADRAMLHADNAYFIPNVRIVSHRLKTHTQSATAYRGFGGPQGMLGIERVMDHLAAESGIEPLTLRQKNFYASGGDTSGKKMQLDAPNVSAAEDDLTSRGATQVDDPETPPPPPEGVQTTPYGQPVVDSVCHEMVEALCEQADYAARKAAVEAFNAANPVLKKGLALTPVKFGISFTLTHLNQAGALVHVYQDGSIHMNHGGTEMGQGLFQKVAQVAASRFGVPLERVKITATDTAKVPNTSATAASSGSDLNGMAVAAACDELKARIGAFLAEVHQADPATVQFKDDAVQVGGNTIPWEKAIAEAYVGRVSLSATGFYKTPGISWDRIKGQGRPFYYFAYGAALTEVVIDTLTGENRMLRVDILHDAGSSLNPALDIGQVEGGFIQGAGWLTTEELVWDAKGRLTTHAPSTYKIPACSDRPPVFNVALWPNANREPTIYRSKAVGEPPFMLGISALMALSNACAACGPHYPALEAPATAEHVLEAIARARG
ncbi:xanthine dehydrogenase molybdopterin binding subunit [Vannielia litorea]|uniref:xanthine dehydrogenase molybdopterin binding subunit n=1 Tax=Vannielia litorea TaxID=1217970 RepID=UPI001C97CBCD|nr:xanthine dehydrogenase molybdopterin binding subunit [Vannielia litorea]MBY6046269.1 xanthine dehydrogenase molybdopterin binding subunit [Vannielia litorea]MBY6073682.1 xanthine dehydrogenase molybdopterin binding subunit [Vannielia litorea]